MAPEVAHRLQRVAAVRARMEDGVSWLALAGCVLPLLVACEHHPRQGPFKEPPPAPTSEDTIHVGALSGKLDGKEFSVKTARYYIDARPGFEKVDIKLYGAASKTPCGELDDAKPPSVWLRRVGSEKLVAEKTTTTVQDGGKWEVHYQIQDDGFWLGQGEANALIVLQEVGPDLKLPGVLSACFRDTTGSCVAGEFSASYCRVSIDEPVRGTGAMERPKKIAPLVPPPPSSSAAPGPSSLGPTPSAEVPGPREPKP